MIDLELPVLPGTTSAQGVTTNNSSGVQADWAARVDGALGHGVFLLMPLFLIAFGVIAAIHSFYRPIWFDEWFTYELARLPSLGQIIDALGRGPEQAPPLDYLARRLSMAVIGDKAWAFRFPSVIATGLAMICVYGIVARRLGASYAWASTLILLVGPGWFYATEARPYALMLGFIALAMLCWQRAEGGEGRTLPLVGLFLAVAAAQSSHYYAIIGVAPLFLGQLVRSWRTRRVDAIVWLTLLAGASVILAYIPLILHKRMYIATFWARPAWSMVPELIEFCAGMLPIPLILLLSIAGAGLGTAGAFSARRPRLRTHCSGYRPEELAVALGYVFLPAFAVLLAKLAHGVVTDRYVLPSTIGFALLIPACIARFTLDAPAGGLALAGAIGLWFGLDEGGTLLRQWKYPEETTTRSAELLLSASGASADPVFIPEDFIYFETLHDLPKALAARIVCVCDRPATELVPLRMIRPFLPSVRLLTTREIAEARSPALLYTTGRDRELALAIPSALLNSGAELRLLACRGDRRLYRLTWPCP